MQDRVGCDPADWSAEATAIPGMASHTKLRNLRRAYRIDLSQMCGLSPIRTQRAMAIRPDGAETPGRQPAGMQLKFGVLSGFSHASHNGRQHLMGDQPQPLMRPERLPVALRFRTSTASPSSSARASDSRGSSAQPSSRLNCSKSEMQQQVRPIAKEI